MTASRKIWFTSLKSTFRIFVWAFCMRTVTRVCHFAETHVAHINAFWAAKITETFLIYIFVHVWITPNWKSIQTAICWLYLFFSFSKWDCCTDKRNYENERYSTSENSFDRYSNLEAISAQQAIAAYKFILICSRSNWCSSMIDSFHRTKIIESVFILPK